MPINNIVGTNGSDTLTGTGEKDHIYGFEGIDILIGLEGDDTLDGGANSDSMIGGIGNDTYWVDNPLDQVIELAGEGTWDKVNSKISYTLGANVENLTLLDSGGAINGTGNDLDNSISGNASANVLIGGGGKDWIVGGGGIDTMIGGTENDSYVLDQLGDVVIENAGEGRDQVYTTFSYTLGANLEILNLSLGIGPLNGTGNSLDNDILGTESANTLVGLGGDDWLVGLGGVDLMVGGIGDDDYSVDDPGDVVSESANEGTDWVVASVSYTLGAHVEYLCLSGGAGAINGTGNGLDNQMWGNESANTINGGAGNDMLSGMGGPDTLIGGIGDDIFYGGAGSGNTLIGGGGNDTYWVDAVADVIIESPKEGIDVAYATVSTTLGANVEHLTLLAGWGAINGTGNGGNNTIIGNEAGNVLNGGGGHDDLDGRGGADTMIGGANSDTYRVDNAGDVVVENANEGIDRVYTMLSYTLGANVENLTLLPDAGAINGTGNELDNTMNGNGANNTLLGGGGDDILEGGFGYGADILDGGIGDDLMMGGAGNDQYFVDSAGDIIIEAPNSGQDQDLAWVSLNNYVLAANVEDGAISTASGITLTGNWWNNVLTGNAGNDTLAGADGNDTLTGGAGQDGFLFNTALDAVDQIIDFSVADDTILLDHTVFFALPVGALAASAFYVGSAAADASHRIIYNSATGALLYDFDGYGDGIGNAPAVQLAQLSAGLAGHDIKDPQPNISHLDFMIV